MRSSTVTFRTVMRFWHLKQADHRGRQGYCLAGGCELALCCDITIAAEDAVFGEPELKFGAGIVVMILPWLVGPKHAKEIILSGMDRISARRQLRIGLINRVVPADQLEFRRARARPPHRRDRSASRAADQAGDQPKLRDHGSGRGAGCRARHRPRDRRAKAATTNVEFMEIARKDGLRAAIAWRDARFREARQWLIISARC